MEHEFVRKVGDMRPAHFSTPKSPAGGSRLDPDLKIYRRCDPRGGFVVGSHDPCSSQCWRATRPQKGHRFAGTVPSYSSQDRAYERFLDYLAKATAEILC